jgi:RNA polymerase sigma factor (sigma-70 family)
LEEDQFMASVERSSACHHLEAVYRAGSHCGISDRELLDRFVDRDADYAEPAFATLVARHGPMVMGVCRRILNHPEDAADAFQATFLVLVRKASTLRVEGSLGRWLHGVSRRIALQARKVAARRAAREVEYAKLPTAFGHDPVRDELGMILDEEITRLPGKYRSAIVLCDLEGLTHDAAARQLGCPSGTIESRLARGRQRLRSRLVQRGIAPSVVPLATSGGRSFVPPKLSVKVVRMAIKVASDDSLAGGARAHALAASFLKAALTTELKTIALAVALVAVGASGVALGSRARAGEPRSRGPQAVQVERESPRPAPEIIVNGRTAYDPNTVVKIRSRFDTLVEKVHVELGQKVKEGDPLVDLKSTDLATAKNDFQTAHAQWQRDFKLRTLRERLFQAGAISQQLLSDTRNDENKSRLVATTARQKLRVYEVPEQQIDALVTNLVVPSKQIPGSDPTDKARMARRSPIDGVVIQRDVVPGNLYDHNDVLIVVASLDPLLVWANLSRADRARVKVGQRCLVELPYVSGSIPSEVDYIAEQPSRDKPGMFRVRFKIPNADGWLKADMLVRVRISLEAE